MGRKEPQLEVKPDTTASGSLEQKTFPIVGIGASAGGLEACSALLRALPTNLGMAYVVVPHLDPSRESAFREILARATEIPVLDVTHGIKVESNHVYVIPPNCEMTIAGGILHLAHREKQRGVSTIIDIFLRSLAADQGSNAIGVILSGTASDGTVGLTAIKGEGGITFAQDSTAKYDGMPASAIAAGCVDLVLPPEGIARELTRIARHPYVRDGGAGMEMAGKTKEAQMAQIFGILRRATRVDFSEYKPPTIGRRVARRMALHRIEKLGDYLDLLRKQNNEVTALYEDLLISVTSFFRDPEAFAALKKIVYPELLKRRSNGGPAIRIWVPGCSSGEETYSHAISLVEFLDDARSDLPIQIFGTDLSKSAIQRAAAGLYRDTIEADVSAVRLRRFFRKIDSGYQISKTIRDLCIFSTQNVFSDPPFSRLDLVSCRNVMIYLGQPLQRRVAPIFHYALNPGGFLMIGNTEGLLGSGAELFEMQDKKQKIYRKRSVPTPLTFGFSLPLAERHTHVPGPPVTSKPPEPAPVPVDLHREADRLLLARYAPPSVVVNDQLEIIQTRGHTGEYLELPTGRASLDLLKMARPGLLHELQGTIEEARKTGAVVTRENVPVDSSDGMNLTSIRVTPFTTPIEQKRGFVISFESAAESSVQAELQAPTTPLTDDERSTKDRQNTQLKQELAATKEYLQSFIEALESTNEEMQSANEEIQSGNEELQSTNEELQTSKEELESANEELHTVNDEMQRRNDQLAQLNNDLTNLLNSVSLPLVMVGPDLSVRRFTPQASRALGLSNSDVGTPLSRLRLKVDTRDLEQKMLEVMEEIRPKEARIQVAVGQWYDLRLTSYRTADNRIDGVVLSIPALDYVQEPDQNRAASQPKVVRAKKNMKKVGKRK